jgi:aminoglycoside phosphotransferase (APT) family kinase protein
VANLLMARTIDYSQIDEASLDAWLSGRLPGYRGRPLLTLISGGQSTPTYRLQSGGRAWVLRKRPPGDWPRYVFPIDREYAALRALGDSAVPVPRVHLLCDDPGVIGGIFYVMDFVDGRVSENAEWPGLTPGERREAFLDLARVCGQIHKFDWRAGGLEGFGRDGGYVERQLSTMSKAYQQAGWKKIPSLERLAAWLPGRLRIPEETCLVHGDYRIGNCLLHRDRPRIAAVLDWELSTLGNPWPDMVYLVQPWYMPPLPMNPQGDFPSLDLETLGIPSVQEMLDTYCETAGRPQVTQELYHQIVVFNLYRTATINHGVGARNAAGTAVNRDAVIFGEMAEPTADYAWRIAQERLGAS